jgi:para-aminobenzoate synthetase component 1
MKPYVIEIPYVTPLSALSVFAHQPGTILLHSERYHEDFARYSFLVTDPFHIFTSKGHQINQGGHSYWGDPFDVLKTYFDHDIETVPDLPPFQGGMVGYLSYELAHVIERLPEIEDDLHIPDIKMGCYDVVVSFDHLQQRCWIVSTGLPEVDREQRYHRAQERALNLVSRLKTCNRPQVKAIYADQLHSNFNQGPYCEAVQKVKDYVFAGDIFQANMSRRFEAWLPKDVSCFDLFVAICQMNPAPFAAYMHWPELSIISASPERFLSVNKGYVETKPIKGTRPRGKSPEEDQKYADELLASEKDRAENLMIVDLMRNDLSRVCLPHSVNVPKLLALESYATVHHLVSTVVGQLKPEYDVIDLLKATFPGGSITGAPKIRAMEIISELEQVARGVYCGSIGYIGFDGTMDTNIAIRTYTKIGQRLVFNAGGAIVADSDPREEFDETTVKALALLKAIGQ